MIFIKIDYRRIMNIEQMIRPIDQIDTKEGCILCCSPMHYYYLGVVPVLIIAELTSYFNFFLSLYIFIIVPVLGTKTVNIFAVIDCDNFVLRQYLLSIYVVNKQMAEGERTYLLADQLIHLFYLTTQAVFCWLSCQNS